MKDSRQQGWKTVWRRRLAGLLAGACVAAALTAASGPGKTAATRPPWQSATLQGQLTSMSNQAASLQAQSQLIASKVIQASTQLAATAAVVAAKKQALDAAGGSDADNAQLEAEFQAAQQQFADQTASLNSEKAQLQEQQSLSSQTQEAQQTLQDAAQGSDTTYQALLQGQPAGGIYAKRAVLDVGAGTINNGGGPCGDYPAAWCQAPPDSIINFGGHEHLNRECVAYTAWKRFSSGQRFGNGDAGDWPGSSQNPTVGSAAIWNRGTVSLYGHVAYVTAVGPDSITVSEFNWQPFVFDSRTIKRNGHGWPSRFLN
jgi:hypothetical protein